MIVLLRFTKYVFVACTLLFSMNSFALTCSLDIDNNGKLDALTDGVLLMRHLFNVTGEALTRDILGEAAQRSNAADISEYLDSPECQQFFDIDGDQRLDALTDGLITTRFLFGFSGNALTQNAISSSATRTVTLEITNLLNEKRISFINNNIDIATEFLIRILPTVSEVQNGDILTVSIVGSNFTTNTDGGSFVLSWDDAVINFSDIQIANSTWDNSFDSRANTTPNSLKISIGNSATTGIGGSFDIATISFNVVGQPGDITDFLMVDTVGGWAQNGILPVNKINATYSPASVRVITTQIR
ncbi:MAG: hypothetical protein V3V22_02205 [Methylococcales bacterium]